MSNLPPGCTPADLEQHFFPRGDPDRLVPCPLCAREGESVTCDRCGGTGDLPASALTNSEWRAFCDDATPD